MWKKRIDISGSRYGRLVVIEYDHTDKDGRACWRCLCDCGNVVVVSGKNLRTGNTKSCGCYMKEAVCPACDYALGHWEFIGGGEKITYCEHCGQAISWEGWKW